MPPDAREENKLNNGQIMAGETLRIGFLGFGEAGYELARGLKEAGAGRVAACGRKGSARAAANKARAEEIGARIAFCRFTGAAADCLLVSGFTELFEVVDSVDEAAARLRRKSAGAAAERLHPHTRAG